MKRLEWNEHRKVARAVRRGEMSPIYAGEGHHNIRRYECMDDLMQEISSKITARNKIIGEELQLQLLIEREITENELLHMLMSFPHTVRDLDLAGETVCWSIETLTSSLISKPVSRLQICDALASLEVKYLNITVDGGDDALELRIPDGILRDLLRGVK